MTDSQPPALDTGKLLSRFTPPGVGIRESLAPVNISWPFPRSFAIYENGLLVRALGTTAWIPRDAIESLHRGRGYIRITWELGGGTSSATISSWAATGKIHRALENAGDAGQHP